MSLSIDAYADGQASGTTTVAATLSTTNAGDIICALVCANRTNAQGSFTSVSGISSTSGLTWNSRTQVQLGPPSGYSTTGAAYDDLELWWAYAPSALSSEVITATTSSTFDDATISVFAVTGFTGTSYHTTPWDNPSSSGTGVYSGSAYSTPSLSSVINTASSNGMILGLVGFNASLTPSAGSGFTAGSSKFNGGGTNFAGTVWEYETFTSQQTGGNVAFGSTTASWMIIADVLATAGQPPPTGTAITRAMSKARATPLLLISTGAGKTIAISKGSASTASSSTGYRAASLLLGL